MPTETGTQNDATHYQASVVRLTDNTMRVYGPRDFPGSVLAAVARIALPPNGSPTSRISRSA